MDTPLNRTSIRRARPTLRPAGWPAARAFGGHLESDPGQAGLPELGEQVLASFLLDAEHGPPPMLLELLQEPGPRERLLVADELGPEGRHEGGGAHLADAEEPLDVPAREQSPVELLDLADGGGDGEKPPGLAGTAEVLSARGRRAVWRRGRGRAGDGGRDVDPPADAPVALPGRLCDGLDVGAGGGGSGSAGCLRLAGRAGRGRGPPRRPRRRRRGPGGRGARRAAGGPPDRPAPRPRRAFRGPARPGCRAGRPPEGRHHRAASQCHDLSPRRRMAARRRDHGHTSHLTGPAPRRRGLRRHLRGRLPGGRRLATRRRVRAGQGRRGVRQ